MHDVAVIGAGAAGLAASIFAAEAAAKGDRPQRIVLLDGVKTIGAKILVSGGGRCNVTHEVVTPTDYFGNRRIIKNVLAAFSVEQTVKWFASLGVELKREKTGKFFPVTDKARTVLFALVERCRELGVEIQTNHRVGNIERVTDHGHGFVIHIRKESYTHGRSFWRPGADRFPSRGVTGLGTASPVDSAIT